MYFFPSGCDEMFVDRTTGKVQSWHQRQFIRWGGAIWSFRGGLGWHRGTCSTCSTCYPSKRPNLRQDAGSTVWHKAWHIKNDVKISRLPVSSPFRAFDNSVASICTWKGLKKLDSNHKEVQTCANSPNLCRLQASHHSTIPFLGTKHVVSDFLPFLPFDLKTIQSLFDSYFCQLGTRTYPKNTWNTFHNISAKVHEQLPASYAQHLPGRRFVLPRNNLCIPGSHGHKTQLTSRQRSQSQFSTAVTLTDDCPFSESNTFLYRGPSKLGGFCTEKTKHKTR